MQITRSKQYGARTHSRESATSPTAKPLATMKTIVYILLLFMATLISGCSKSDLIAKRVHHYPEKVTTSVKEELNFQYGQDIEVLTMDVFYPAITQIEPKYREYIDSNEYRIFLQTRNDSLIDFCCIHMDKYYNVYMFRKERSWPSGVPEKRSKINQILKRKK